MHFDDRLQTLLDARIADPHDRAVRWRQLVDLLARGDAANSSTYVAALDVVRREASSIEEEVRAAAVRAIAGQDVSPGLLAVLAAQPLRVAASLFAGLTLSEKDAAHILEGADADVRALVRVEPAPAMSPDPAGALEARPVPPEPSIGEMVSRIERLQRRRTLLHHAQTPSPHQRPPLRASQAQTAADEERRMFEWESDASGHIAWVEGAPRGVFVGRPLSGDGVGLLDREEASRLVRHHPFVDAQVALGGLFAGTWAATGMPAFDPSTGRFMGYRGVARRTDDAVPAADRPKSEPDLDALREMVHEIKTPLNAIIGFAEIIDGQYLGPAHRLYRERAASIVAQARQLLAAVEDLDFAAKVRAGREANERRGAGPGGREPGAGLSELIRPVAVEVEQCLAVNGAVLELDLGHGRNGYDVSPELAERLLRRLLLSLCKIVSRGEAFRIAASQRGAMCLLTIARPRLLDGFSEAQLVDPAFDPSGGDEAQSVGLGFALRLVRGLARVGGGSLIFEEHRITLELPAAAG